MHEELWSKFKSLDQTKVLQRTKCSRLNNTTECYVITLLNKPYIIDPEERDIFSVQSDSQRVKAGFLEQLCILAYVIHAQDIPLTHRLVKAESLPGGQFFFRGHHQFPTGKLEDVFGKNPERFYRAGLSLGGEKCNFGDVSIQLNILPRIPLTIILWAADKDFNARTSILFDSTVSEQMPLDALHAVVHLAVNAILRQDQTYL